MTGPVKQATLEAQSPKVDRLAPLIDKFTKRFKEAVASYASDNGWPEDARERSQSVCDFLLSIKAVEPMPEIEEFGFVDAVVWRQFCHALWDLVSLKTPVPRGYLNGMRQAGFRPILKEVWETRQDVRAWHAPARRGNVDQILGDLQPENLKLTSPKKSGRKSKAKSAPRSLSLSKQ